MFRSVVLVCVVLWCSGAAEVNQQCISMDSSALKFSISSRRNATGRWVAEVKLEHNAKEEEDGPWDVDVDHVTSKCGSSETIIITATVTAPSSPHKPPSASGYDLVSGLGYYKLHTDVMTWQDARAACEQEGTHLVVINSEAEAKALSPFWDMNPKILDGSANNWAHVGFHDQYKEGQYLTIFNQSLVGAGYVKWSPGEPNGAGSDCGCVYRRDNLMGDIICGAKQPFFCELEL